MNRKELCDRLTCNGKQFITRTHPSGLSWAEGAHLLDPGRTTVHANPNVSASWNQLRRPVSVGVDRHVMIVKFAQHGFKDAKEFAPVGRRPGGGRVNVVNSAKIDMAFGQIGITPPDLVNQLV